MRRPSLIVSLLCGRGKDGVSIHDLGDKRFLVRFVAKRDMQRVFDSEFPWTFHEDLVMVGHCTHRRDKRWKNMAPGEMWVQIHKVPPLRITAEVAMAIRGKVGVVLSVEKSASPERIGRFLRVRIRFNV